MRMANRNRVKFHRNWWWAVENMDAVRGHKVPSHSIHRNRIQTMTSWTTIEMSTQRIKGARNGWVVNEYLIWSCSSYVDFHYWFDGKVQGQCDVVAKQMAVNRHHHLPCLNFSFWFEYIFEGPTFGFAKWYAWHHQCSKDSCSKWRWRSWRRCWWYRYRRC